MRVMILCVWMTTSSVVFGGQPGPVNPHEGTQTREEVFEFAERPTVKKTGGKYVITFATKGKCDATVAIVGPDGKIVRHLASGVLGENAPPPFEQGTLAQRIEWDGKDDAGRPVPAGCKVKVCLGLTARYGTSIAQSPHIFQHISALACDSRGNLYVAEPPVARMPVTVRVFSRDGDYLRTVSPPPGGLKPEEYAGFDVVGPPGNPFFVPRQNVAVSKHEPVMGMTVSSQGELVFSNSGFRIRKFLTLVRSDGANLRHGSQLGPWQLATGPAFLAFDRDENHVYVGGMNAGNVAKRGVYHCVFRFGLNDPTPEAWVHSHDWSTSRTRGASSGLIWPRVGRMRTGSCRSWSSVWTRCSSAPTVCFTCAAASSTSSTGTGPSASGASI